MVFAFTIAQLTESLSEHPSEIDSQRVGVTCHAT